jgi:hypothetical protein
VKPSAPIIVIDEPGVPDPGASVPPATEVWATKPVPASVPPVFTVTPLDDTIELLTTRVPPLIVVAPM